MKLAIVGGGPSSFYVASRLLQLCPLSNSPFSRIHIFDRLWAPHGLVRYGIAPDHPEVKNCVHKFDGAAKDPRLQFFGNVNVGGRSESIPHAVPLPLTSVFANYSHVLFASGCTVPVKHLALPPSSHVIPALSVVHWYTQHPANTYEPDLGKTKHVTIVGQGNVALDVARMLLSPVSVLSKYDVPQRVLEVLERSRVEHVSIVGRRGPYQAAFTTKEVRELLSLPNASMKPLDTGILQPVAGATVSRQQSRIIQLLEKGSKQPFGSTPRTWSLDFFRSPTDIILPPSSEGQADLKVAHTVLDPVTGRAVSTGQTSSIATDLVVTALGHRAEPEGPWYDPNLGHLRVAGGRVLDEQGRAVRRVYASGWAAMGAKGVLATTLMDAHAVTDTILSDLPNHPRVKTTPVVPGAPIVPDVAESQQIDLLNSNPDPERPPPEVEQGLQNGDVTTYEDWKRVDEEEVRRGAAMGKERERMDWVEARAFLAGKRGPSIKL